MKMLCTHQHSYIGYVHRHFPHHRNQMHFWGSKLQHLCLSRLPVETLPTTLIHHPRSHWVSCHSIVIYAPKPLTTTIRLTRFSDTRAIHDNYYVYPKHVYISEVKLLACTALFTVLAIWDEREVCACAKNNQSCSFLIHWISVLCACAVVGPSTLRLQGLWKTL